MAVPRTLATGLRSFGIQFIPFAKRRLLGGITEVQLWMTPLGL
jgi:hypothetical protein